MVAVFAAFIPSPDVVLKVIGVGMAAAIFIDATVVRLLLVPAVMHMLGKANWWMPAWLGRILPELHVEGHPEDHLPARVRRRPALRASRSQVERQVRRREGDVDRGDTLDPGAVDVTLHLAPRPPEVQPVVLELDDREVVVVPGAA